MWDVEFTDQFETWWDGLTLDEQGGISVAIEALQRVGPGLGRPRVDTVSRSRHSNMKELRPPAPANTIRILFAFDPRRMAILLIGGDKRNRWTKWYEEMIPVADDLYDEHLDMLRREGEVP